MCVLRRHHICKYIIDEDADAVIKNSSVRTNIFVGLGGEEGSSDRDKSKRVRFMSKIMNCRIFMDKWKLTAGKS